MNFFRTAFLSNLLECFEISDKWNIPKYRRSLPELSCRKRILNNFARFTGKQLHESFFKKVVTQLELTCSELTIERVEQGLKNVQS